MTETGRLSRKKKVRAAHRASVTRMIDQVQEMLSSGEGLNAAKLKQRKQALQAKTELLNKLDEEIVEMVPEDGLDEEVEQADLVRERIELAIIELNGALYGTGTKSRRRSPTHSESDERERSEEPPANPLIHDDESHNPHTDGSHRTSRETTPTDSSSHAFWTSHSSGSWRNDTFAPCEASQAVTEEIQWRLNQVDNILGYI